MAVGGGGHKVAWTVATCALVAGAMTYALAGAHGPLGVSDRSGLVSMVVGLPALVLAVVAALWARPGAYEDEEAAVARLAREVRSVGEATWLQRLGGDLTAIDVTFTFRPYANARAAALPPTPQGQLERVVEDYRALRPRRLVITGEPGAGKTVLAWKLVMELNRTRTEHEPVPVLMALADWDEEEQVGDWIARHLERDYGLSLRSARKVVDARMVLPVLDGLDEMDASDTPANRSRARVALEALARHQDGTEPAPLVLTCRTSRYDALEADADHILDAARIEIDAVTAERAVRFLEQRGAARRPAVWQPLLNELRTAPGGAVSRALSTPWRLTLVATVYERDGDPGELPAAASLGETADLLLRRYVDAAVDSVGDAPRGARAEEVHRRLAVLARALDSADGAQTDLSLRNLSGQLGGRRPRNVLRGLVAACSVASLWLLVISDGLDPATVAVTLAAAVLSPAIVLSERLESRFRTAWYVPPLGSPLWRVGIRLTLNGRGPRRWMLVKCGAVALCWTMLVAPRSVGGLGQWATQAPLAPWLLTGAVVLAIWWLDVAAVGPSGWVRGGVVAMTGTACTLLAVYLSWNEQGNALVAVVSLGALALAGCCQWVEYGICLLLTPGLPLRLARFLDWCVVAGLMRASGVTYQFRHREFQEWLVRHPLPVPASVPAD
ncbi:NACHT domain-containing NTPase [Streptomyces cylindrosporus]|uniref:NACHT domain-containing protein n=1 Tax=Streptomyces cylindrosporus TaxID=2927583 RepID=A0ABS9Y5R4_9ACTN|nr:NACHT domain-containing protein [Streptomyces cylindrosporus]MCI3272548.1 NACHT domain-containing protein [Streptomyces cylindrosporus]